MPQEKNHSGGGLSVQTLVVSALAAVIAAVVVSYLVPRGTLFATALTPVIVAIASELLRRPSTVVKAVPKVVTARGTAVQDGPREREPERSRDREWEPEREPERSPEREWEPPRDDPFGLYDQGPARGAWWRDRRVRLGLVTGLVAFAIGAAAVTASDLLAGSSVGGGGRTTLFSGDSKAAKDEERKDEATPTATPTAAPEEAEPQATSTPPPAVPTGTPAPEATPSATPGATPSATPPPGATPVP